MLGFRVSIVSKESMVNRRTWREIRTEEMRRRTDVDRLKLKD
jgi:hypothetical protein